MKYKLVTLKQAQTLKYILKDGYDQQLEQLEIDL